MKLKIGICIAGVFALDSDGKIVAKRLFEKDAKFIATKLANADNEIEELKKELSKKGYKDFETTELDARSIALKTNWVENNEEFNKIMSAVNIERTKSKLRKTERDKIAMQVAGMMDSVDKNVNVFVEHLREWYGLYFPEANDFLKDNEKFSEFVATKTLRDKFERNGKKLDFESAGMSLSEDDLEEIKQTAHAIFELFERRKKLESYLNGIMLSIAPNTSRLAGSFLTAKLIALAGGLDKLAKLPSSTIQLLGAEKAMFRFLKGQGRSPKHGIIYFHPNVIGAPKPLRGKIARLLASKISIASRTDFYSKAEKIVDMKTDFDRNVEKITKSFREHE